MLKHVHFRKGNLTRVLCLKTDFALFLYFVFVLFEVTRATPIPLFLFPFLCTSPSLSLPLFFCLSPYISYSSSFSLTLSLALSFSSSLSFSFFLSISLPCSSLCLPFSFFLHPQLLSTIVPGTFSPWFTDETVDLTLASKFVVKTKTRKVLFFEYGYVHGGDMGINNLTIE